MRCKLTQRAELIHNNQAEFSITQTQKKNKKNCSFLAALYRIQEKVFFPLELVANEATN